MVPSERPTKGLLQLGKRSCPDKEKQDPRTSHCCENSTFTSGLIGRDTFASTAIKSSQHCRAEQLRPQGVSLPHSVCGALPGPCAGVRHAQHPSPSGQPPRATQSCTDSPAEHKALLSFCERSLREEAWWSSSVPSKQPSPTQTHQIPDSCCPCQHLGGRGPQLCDRSWLPGAAECVS